MIKRYCNVSKQYWFIISMSILSNEKYLFNSTVNLTEIISIPCVCIYTLFILKLQIFVFIASTKYAKNISYFMNTFSKLPIICFL